MTVQFGRFTLRSLGPWDADALFKLTSNPKVTRYMGFRAHTSSCEAGELLQRYCTHPNAKFMGAYLDGTELAGTVGFEIRGHQAVVMIMFGGDWKSRGAGREISAPFVKWLFTHPQIWRVCAYCHVDNVPVQRVLERMGAEREGRLRRLEYFLNISDEPQDVYVYSIVKDRS